MKGLLLLLSLLATLPCYFSGVIWNKPSDWNAGLPSSISVFQTNSSFTPGIPMTAAYSKIDLSDSDLELRVVHSEGANLKTPLDYIQDSPNLVYVAMNGGYFDMTTNISVSLVISNSSVIAGGLTSIDETLNGQQVPYYPTRGAFGVHEDKTPEIFWTYDIDSASNIYAYPEPSPNCFNCNPQEVPTSQFPAGGQQWNVTHAVGAGPMMMRGGIVNVTAGQELFYDPTGDARNPRTGICITHDKTLIFIVVDGRYDLSGGLFIVELADLMAELGCRDALNLDGGGSTAMIANGFVTNHPSDKTGMRPVTSALLVVSKTKPNPFYGGYDWHTGKAKGEKGVNSFRGAHEFEDTVIL